MRRRCKSSRLPRLAAGLAALGIAAIVASCGDATAPAATPGEAEASEAESALRAASGASPTNGASLTAQAARPLASSTLPGRSREIVNPEEATVVLLYLDLAGLPPRHEQWVEEDMRVKFAPPIDKPAQRAAVRAEIDSAAAAVRDIGLVRLSLSDARLSDYDPAYGEFTIGAFAPSSIVEFSAFGMKVNFRFGNGRTAQIWRVPAAEAQAIRDRLNSMRTSAEVDALLVIRDVQPGPNGGTIVVDVLEYELRDPISGTALVRVDLSASPPAASPPAA